MTTDSYSIKVWPKKIKLVKRDRTLQIDFDDGNSYSYSAEYLRVESPSAEVQGHGASQKHIIAGCRSVGISTIETVGNYAIRIHFDDNHDTGIFSWSYLHELGRTHSEKWQRYLKMLENLGLSRDS